jgi:hypothetical protein
MKWGQPKKPHQASIPKMTTRDPSGFEQRAYDNGSKDWHTKPSVIIGMIVGLLGLGTTVIGLGFWAGRMAERIDGLEADARDNAPAIAAVGIIQSQVADIRSDIGTIKIDIKQILRRSSLGRDSRP